MWEYIQSFVNGLHAHTQCISSGISPHLSGATDSSILGILHKLGHIWGAKFIPTKKPFCFANRRKHIWHIQKIAQPKMVISTFNSPYFCNWEPQNQRIASILSFCNVKISLLKLCPQQYMEQDVWQIWSHDLSGNCLSATLACLHCFQNIFASQSRWWWSGEFLGTWH